jgi:adenine-specific DNA-methyltransferase
MPKSPGLTTKKVIRSVQEPEKNVDSNGRFHTDWLNMIYPRLKVARDLLTEDGVIFISIDDQ